MCTEITIHDYCKTVDENFVINIWNNESRYTEVLYMLEKVKIQVNTSR